MTCRLLKILLPILLLAGWNAPGAATQTRVELLLDHEVAAPGQTIIAGVSMTMPEGWHTYWRNPGDSGKATEIKWQLPNGITAGEIQWPVPEKYESEGFFTYVFHKEVVLRVPLTIGPDATLGPTAIRATVDWLECKELCLPGTGEVSESLTLAKEARKSAAAEVIEAWSKRLPVNSPELTAAARWADETSADERQLIIEARLPAGVAIADFFPHLDKSVEIGATTEISDSTAVTVVIRKSVTRFGEAAWPKLIAGSLISKPGSSVVAYELSAEISRRFCLPLQRRPPARPARHLSGRCSSTRSSAG